MTQHIKKRAKGFFTAKFPGHVLILLFLWLITSVRVWVIFLATYLIILIAAFVYELFKAWRYMRERAYAKEVRRLTFLLRNLIDLAFTYNEDPEKFYRKFLETVSVESLGARGLIEPDVLLRTPKYNRLCRHMRRDDAELWILLMAGFQPRELKVIYGLNNINSVYVKRNRLKSRLKKHMRELIENKDDKY